MAKAEAKAKKEITMEEALWKSADKLRGSVEPAEYKHVVLSLFFLKFASDKFEAQRKAIADKYGERFVDNVAFYTKDNVFYLPEESRWSYIIGQAKQDDIALKIDTALFTIEKANPALKGALPDNYYSRLHIDTAKLASLLDEIDRINTDDAENDIIGRVYEYFLSKFALAEGKGKGELIPPKQIDADTSIYNVFYRDDFIFNPARMELNSIAINDKYDRAICSSLYEVFYVHRKDLLLPHYLKLIVKQKWFTRYCEFLGQGSAREYCRFNNISEIEIEFPSIEEQEKIVEQYTILQNRIAIKKQINDNLAA